MSSAELASDGHIRVVVWRPLRRNTLRGFATIEIGPWRLHDVPVHMLNERKWCTLPGKALLVDGEVQRDERGRIRYGKVLDWTNAEKFQPRFRAAVLHALERDFPDALIET